MIKFFQKVCTLLLVTVAGYQLMAQTPSEDKANKREWWLYDELKPFKISEGVKKLPYIKVKGNAFVDENGKVVVFKGLSISDPDKLVKDGRWSKKHFEVIKSWGANLVRIPVHPISVRQRGLENYIKLLDDAVTWSSELGIYLIIDWHSIGNLHTEILANENYDTTKKETFEFWRTIAKHYKDVPTIAFYELFNEPTIYDGQYGRCTWGEWKTLMEQIIDIIYVHDKNVVPLVAGFDWAYDLTSVKDNPVAREGIGYVTHPYPGKRSVPREPKWEENFGFVANKYPVIATEIGFMKETDDRNLLDDGIYGASIMNYLNKKGISWVAWVFDPVWVPQMIHNWEYEPTLQGKFFRDVMQGKFKYNK